MRKAISLVVVAGWGGRRAVVDGRTVYLAEQGTSEANEALAAFAVEVVRLRTRRQTPK